MVYEVNLYIFSSPHYLDSPSPLHLKSMYSPIAANILGTLGAVCWSIQLLPQIFINARRYTKTPPPS